jgi:acyl carrier protein
MQKTAVLQEIETIIEADAGTLDGSEKLADLEGWDSLAILSFLALADSSFQRQIPPERVSRAQTVDDLVGLLS